MHNRNYFKTLFWATIILVIGITGLIYTNGYSEETVRIVVRTTAKLSVVLFSFAFGSSSIYYFLKNDITAAILKYRAYLGLSFGVTHTFHLLALFILHKDFQPIFEEAETIALFGGGLAYLFIYLMMITTFSSVKARFSTFAWRILHRTGSYWIWFIFFRSYFKNVYYKDQYYVFFFLLATIMILRFLQMASRRKKIVAAS